MTAMLAGLVTQIADDLRAAIGPPAANDDSGPELFAELHASGLLDIPDLIALLLHRAEQIGMSEAIRSRGPGREGRLVQSLISDRNAKVAAAAMALILARGRRLDQFSQCRIEYDDVPASAVAPLVHAVAAAVGRAQPQPAVATGAAGLISRHDPSRSLAAGKAALIETLDGDRRLDDEWLLSAAEEGEGALLAHALARRAGISPDDAADALLSRDGGQLMLLLKLAEVGRERAAHLLASLCDVLGIADPAAALARFDGFTAAELDRARLELSLPQAYREAVAVFGSSVGQRSF